MSSLPIVLLLSLVVSALAFFLASFQVHEKSLLLALVPAAFLVPYEPLMGVWFQVLGAFTMFPLLQRDGLSAAYGVSVAVYVYIAWQLWRGGVRGVGVGVGVGGSQVASGAADASATSPPPPLLPLLHTAKVLVVGVSTAGMLALHVAERLIAAPPHYPHLYPALFSLYGAANLTAVYLFCALWLLHITGVFVCSWRWGIGAGGSSDAT
jgi:alpha-1,3-glucosyltransferase